MNHDRRAILAAIGVAVPFALDVRAAPSRLPPAPSLRLRSFEDAVREAFGVFSAGGRVVEPVGGCPVRRIEVGHCDQLEAGLQGCYNARPFAGFPVGFLRIVRTGLEPGPAVGGVRLYAATVDVALTYGKPLGGPGRGFDFALLPPAPTLSAEVEQPRSVRRTGGKA